MDAKRKPGIVDTSISDEMHTLRRQKIDPEFVSEDELATVFGAKAMSFDEWAEASRRRLAQFLMDQGWPDPDQRINYDDKGWKYQDPQSPEAPEANPAGGRQTTKNEIGWKYIENKADEFSQDWFCARLCQHLFFLDLQAGGDRIWTIWQIGHLVSTMEHRTFFPDVLKVRDRERFGREGGFQRGRNLADEKSRRLDRMAELIAQGHSQSRAAEIAARQGYGKSKGANLQLWKRHKKSKE